MIKFFLIVFSIFSLSAQTIRSPMDRKKDIIRDFNFNNYVISDIQNDSLRVLSYVSIPNASLQFLKENDKFISNYEITITLKNDDDELIGRKNWSNKILTNSYLESISKEISTLHFHEFKIPSGKYSITSELADIETRESKIKLKKIELDAKSKVEIYSMFIIDSLDGFWGLNQNELPLFNNIFPSQSDFITFFVSGKIEPGNFNLDISITNAGRDKIWDNSIDINSKKNSFVKRILLPKDVLSSGLRKMITVNISQNKFKDKKTLIFASKRAGIASSIGSMDQAIASMRYILQDKEWKEFKKANKDDRELIFLDYWSKKDPTPKTKENELQNEYFKRVEFANANFKGYKEGWDSQMGMIYILFGRPDDVEEYNDPIGRYYQQRWHYYKVNKFFDFVDENGFGQYKLTTPFFHGQVW